MVCLSLVAITVIFNYLMPSNIKYAKKSAFLLLLCVVSFTSYAQSKKSGEVGISVGGSYYLGELNKTAFVGTNISAGAFYRHTIDTRYAITGEFTYGTLSGDMENTVFKHGGIETFKKHFYEIGGIGEFNFKPFLPGNKKYIYTPYVFAGLACAYYPKGTTEFILNIPFGIGVKYNLNTNFILGGFMGMHKTFTDNIDYAYVPPSETNVIKQWGYEGNKDLYSVFGVTLSYKIKYSMKCPAFD